MQNSIGSQCIRLYCEQHYITLPHDDSESGKNSFFSEQIRGDIRPAHG
jgi:hypothetical protein